MITESEKLALKRKIGRAPFDTRVKYTSGDRGPCPVHGGDGPNFHVYETNGIWLGTCHSKCAKTFDAIGIVQACDKVNFLEAVRILQGKARPVTEEGEEGKDNVKPKAEKSAPVPMTAERWEREFRIPEQSHIDILAASRQGLTPSLETFQELGFRIGTPPYQSGDWLVTPYAWTDPEGTVHFDLVKYRKLAEKDIKQYNVVESRTFGNLDTISCAEDLYVVEGDIDFAVMEAADFRTVTVNTGGQRKFKPEHLRWLLAAERIFLIGDQADAKLPGDPGQGCMDALQKALLEAAGTSGQDKIFRIQFSDAHDVSELAKLDPASFAARIIELRDEALEPWVVKNIPRIHELPQEVGKWVVHEILPYGGLAMISGDQGSLKSYFGQFAAKAIAFGGFTGTVSPRTFLGRAVMDHIPVLYIDRENSLSTINTRRKQMGIIGSDNFFYWNERSNIEYATPEPDDPRLLEFARRRNAYIIFDSLQDWYGDASEIDNTAMVALMSKFQRLATAGAGVLVLHHFDKNFKKPRGGTAITAITDMSMKSAKEGRGLVTITEDRFRMCGKWELKFEVHFSGGVFRGESEELAAERAEHCYWELIYDKTSEQLAGELLKKQAELDKARTKEEREAIERVVKHIETKPTMSPRKMEDVRDLGRNKSNNPCGIRESKIRKLAGIGGWSWTYTDTSKGEGLWKYRENSEPPDSADDPPHPADA